MMPTVPKESIPPRANRPPGHNEYISITGRLGRTFGDGKEQERKFLNLYKLSHFPYPSSLLRLSYMQEMGKETWRRRVSGIHVQDWRYQ